MAWGEWKDIHVVSSAGGERESGGCGVGGV